MTKYIAQKATHKNCYHTNRNCQLLNKEPREATENEINWHDLELCPQCELNKYIPVNNRNSKKEVYHTDRTCKRIDGDVRVVAKSEIEYHDLSLCTWCDPEIEAPNAQYEQDHSYQNALKNAAKDN